MAMIEDVDLPESEAVEPAKWSGLRNTDVDNGLRLVDIANGRLRYVHAWGKFLTYSAGVWHIDFKDARTFDIAKGVSDKLYSTYTDIKTQFEYDLAHGNLSAQEQERLETFLPALYDWAKYSASSAGIHNMITQVRGMDGLLIQHEQLDDNPYLFNCANGTFDFTPVKDDPMNGAGWHDHDPNDLLMMQSPVAYNKIAECPIWDECLETWQPDPEIRRYLQMRAGACALGINTETLDIDWGEGANGKSKFHGAIQYVLGDYALVPHKSLLMSHRFDEHATVYADLFRKRLAAATETKAGETLDEESVKHLTGGDRQKGRRMREDYWEFWPSHTLILYTNYRPKIKGTDEAIWRRVHLVPWSVTIPEDQRDTELAEKLKDEAPGILRWILNGALMYLRDGWQVPESIKVATDDYRDDEDLVGRFLADCLEITKDPEDIAYFSEIQFAADQWIESEGLQYKFSPRQITDALTRLGAKQGKRVMVLTSKVTQWHGVRMLLD